MDTLDHILTKYRLDAFHNIIDIPDVNRIDLIEIFNELGFKEGAEIGVEQGLYSKIICSIIPDVKLHAVDAWEAYSGYRDHVSQRKLDGFFENTKQRLEGHDVNFIRKYSVEAAEDIPDESLDFVYIDANHDLLNVIQDLFAWVPKVRRGGIISGHDYVRRKKSSLGMHVVEAVNAYTKAFHIRPLFILGRKDKVSGEKRDNSRSWFWVKE